MAARLEKLLAAALALALTTASVGVAAADPTPAKPAAAASMPSASANLLNALGTAPAASSRATPGAAPTPTAPVPAATAPATATPGPLLLAAPMPSASGAAMAPLAAASGPAGSASAAETAMVPAGTLDSRVQDIKSDVIKLNRDLLVLEEELLFPANTQVAFFVSMDVGKMFQLDSVQIRLDDKVVANYLYTALEVEALHRGGVQRVYVGNLRTGSHELVAVFNGKGPHERDYRRGATVKFEKSAEAKYIELRISDSQGKLQPEFDVKLWQ